MYLITWLKYRSFSGVWLHRLANASLGFAGVHKLVTDLASIVMRGVLCRKPTDDVEKGPAAAADAGKSQPVKFQIAADDDDEDKPEGAHLLSKPPPYIMIESPSSVKIAGDSGSPTNV